AGQRYEAVAALGELREVPLRATLKQFEATWRGPMDGTLEASLRRERAAAINLHPESWIHNKLGTDLTDCYLLVPTANSGWPDHGRLGVRTYYIGKLADGKRMTIAETDEARAAARGETLKVQYLTDLQQSWLSRDFRVRMDPNWGMVRNAE